MPSHVVTTLLLAAAATLGEATPRVLQGYPTAPPGSRPNAGAPAAANPVQAPQTICKGDTRGDQRCNHDPTHRVCAQIGDVNADGSAATSFWQHTRQTSWCGTRGRYYGTHGSDVRCPPENPTWCICKWATADWIQGESCNDQINIDCAASDICATSQGLYFSYNDYQVNLQPAHLCAAQKCPTQWATCAAANPNFVFPGGGGH